MIYCYFIPVVSRITLVTLLLLGGALGAVSFLAGLWQRDRTAGHIFGTAFEILCLIYNVAVCFMSGVYLQTFMNGFIDRDFFLSFRTVFPFLILIGSVIFSLIEKRPTGAVMTLSCFLMSIWSERLSGAYFPYAVFVSAVLLFARNLTISCYNIKKLKKSISILSIKAAIDTLPTGIMLCETNGRPRLVNGTMKSFVENIGGTLDRGGNAFWKYVYFAELPNGIHRHMLGDCPVIVMPDKTAFMLTRDLFAVGKKTYFQTTVKDVTRRWSVNESLTERRKQLAERSRELAELLSSVDRVCRDRELIAARGRVHDVLGHRITIFQRYLNSGKMPSKRIVSELVDDLSERLRNEQLDAPEKRMNDLRETLSSVGVTVVIHGEMPENLRNAECFFRILREASTNSVRHGFATVIDVYFDSDGENDTMTVCDNGKPPEGEVHYRTGITGMQIMTVEEGGSLEIIERPNFTVKAVLPGGEKANG